MADGSPDDQDDGDDARPSAEAEAEIGGAVDDALADEMKRQKARFVQHLMGLDRIEGVGRADEHWHAELDRRLGLDRPDEPSD